MSSLNLPVGSTTGRANTALLYCNGIMATEQEAKEQSDIISDAFKGHKVDRFHNPTKLDGYVSTDCAEEDKQAELANQLAAKIQQLLSTHKNVLLFAHSHGASLVKNAASKLDPKDRQKISVYTFGGVAMIPNRLAGKVDNFVFEQDMIARTGNKRYDRTGTLDRVIQIAKKMREYGRADTLDRVIMNTKKIREEGSSLAAAAIQLQCAEDTYLSLDSLTTAQSERDPATRADKARRFGQGFLGGDESVFNEEVVKESLLRYTSCITDYNIQILSRPFKAGASSAEIGPDSLCKATIKTMCQYGQYSLLTHILPAFTESIQQIAKEFIEANPEEFVFHADEPQKQQVS